MLIWNVWIYTVWVNAKVPAGFGLLVRAAGTMLCYYFESPY